MSSSDPLSSDSSDVGVVLDVTVYEDGEPQWQGGLQESLELGRQNVSGDHFEPAPYAEVRTEGGRRRLVIADKSERKISRRHVLLSIEGEVLRVVNISRIQPVDCNHEMLDAQAEKRFDLLAMVRLGIGSRTIVIGPTSDSGSLRSLAHPTKSPGGSSVKDRTTIKIRELPEAPSESIMAWLSDMVDVLHSAAGSADFQQLAVQAAVDIVKLDHGQLLCHEDGRWNCTASFSPTGSAKPPMPSQIVLRRMLDEGKTFWFIPEPDVTESLAGVTTVIAAPILDADGNVIAAMYGDRRSGADRDSISDIEARMFEVLACAVASGLARLREQEQAFQSQIEAAETRTRLEQFFSPTLAAQLLEQPSLLEGRDVEVTVLFCDLRDFTAVSERMAPREMLRWVNAAQDALSDCVIDFHGVLVDYVGDELLAMWGAPADQPDHAVRACRAALSIVRRLPEIDRQWAGVIGQPTEVGIGISTGMALVGNTGSARKFKYGPLGRTVNVGSRVQDATRALETRVLITESTARQLDNSFETRRLGRVRLPSLQAPELLFELAVDPTDDWRRLRDVYQTAIDGLQQGRFVEAQQALQTLEQDWPHDGPACRLRERTDSLDIDETFDDVWNLSGDE